MQAKPSQAKPSQASSFHAYTVFHLAAPRFLAPGGFFILGSELTHSICRSAMVRCKRLHRGGLPRHSPIVHHAMPIRQALKSPMGEK